MKTNFWKKLEERGFDGHYEGCNGDDSCVCMFAEDLMTEGARLKAHAKSENDKWNSEINRVIRGLACDESCLNNPESCRNEQYAINTLKRIKERVNQGLTNSEFPKEDDWNTARIVGREEVKKEFVARDAQTEKELKNLRAAVANAIAYRDKIVARDARIKEKLEAMRGSFVYDEKLIDDALSLLGGEG